MLILLYRNLDKIKNYALYFSTADRRNSLPIIVTTLLLFVSWPLNLLAHDGPVPTSLKGVSVPPVPGLLDGADPIVTDKKEAIALGKALFWDMNVGTDGMSCGSCHFHAGADRRVKNQISPGEKANDDQFDPTASGSAASGPNYQLLPSDYPFINSPILMIGKVKLSLRQTMSQHHPALSVVISRTQNVEVE